MDDKTKPILEQGFDACVDQLTEFGYTGITPEMIKTAHARWKKGEQPIGVIDQFAFGDFEKYPQIFGAPDAPAE